MQPGEESALHPFVKFRDLYFVPTMFSPDWEMLTMSRDLKSFADKIVQDFDAFLHEASDGSIIITERREAREFDVTGFGMDTFTLHARGTPRQQLHGFTLHGTHCLLFRRESQDCNESVANKLVNMIEFDNEIDGIYTEGSNAFCVVRTNDNPLGPVILIVKMNVFRDIVLSMKFKSMLRKEDPTQITSEAATAAGADAYIYKITVQFRLSDYALKGAYFDTTPPSSLEEEEEEEKEEEEVEEQEKNNPTKNKKIRLY